MMNNILILATILMFAIQTLAFKIFNQRLMKNQAGYFIFSFSYFSIVVAVFLAVAQRPLKVHMLTFLLAFGFGTLFMATMLFYMKAMENGPLSFTSLIYSSSLVVPIVLSVLFWNESIDCFQIIGLLLLMLAFYLGSGTPARKGNTGFNAKWAFFSLVSFFGNGILITLTKWHQKALTGKEINEFLIIGFGSAVVLSAAMFFARSFKGEKAVGLFKNKLFLIIVLVAGITTALGNFFSLYLAGRIPSIIQFPLVNGGVVIISSAVSFAFLREQLQLKHMAGLLCGLGAIILLNI